MTITPEALVGAVLCMETIFSLGCVDLERLLKKQCVSLIKIGCLKMKTEIEHCRFFDASAMCTTPSCPHEHGFEHIDILERPCIMPGWDKRFCEYYEE